MVEEKDLKELADEIMKQEGNVKGEVFHTHFSYIHYKEGEAGIQKLEDKLAELGYPLKFKEVKTDQWYKEALSALVIVLAKELFNWSEEDVFEMGNSAPKHSFIVKMFVKHFISVKDVFERAEQYWSKHYDFGLLEKGEFNEEKKYITVKIKGYAMHELVTGPYMKGYITRIAQLSLKSSKIETEQTKNIHHGDPYNEYIIKWV
jgi:hypothetical protein